MRYRAPGPEEWSADAPHVQLSERSGTRLGGRRLIARGLGLALQGFFEPNPQSLTPLEAFALQGGGQPDVTLANIPQCSIAHCFLQTPKRAGTLGNTPGMCKLAHYLPMRNLARRPIAGPVPRELRLQVVAHRAAPSGSGE